MANEIFDDEQDNLAHRNGWLVLSLGEAYERQLSSVAAVYIFKEGSKWILWRAFWPPGHYKPRTEKKLFSHKDFKQVFQRAESYVDWRLNGDKKKSS